MTKKQLFRAIAFALVVASMFVLLSDIFENGSNRSNAIRINSYFDLEKDTLDVALVGTSGIDRYWLAPKAFDEHGIASYAIASNGHPSWFILSVVKDIERKNKDLKLMIIDMRPFGGKYDDGNVARFENRSRSFLDTLPFFSRLRMDAINDTLEVISENVEGESKWDLSYFFPFIKYHSRWSEDNFDVDRELDHLTSEYMGAFIHKNFAIRTQKKVPNTVVTDERSPLDPVCEENLYELLEHFKKQDYEVMFLNTPHAQNERETTRTNTLCDILDKEGFKYINCELDPNMYDIINDFYNSDHVNYYGSEKFTKWFANYLKENYDLPDRRGDDKYYQWVGVYDKIKTTIAGWEKILAAKVERDAEKKLEAAKDAIADAKEAANKVEANNAAAQNAADIANNNAATAATTTTAPAAAATTTTAPTTAIPSTTDAVLNGNNAG